MSPVTTRPPEDLRAIAATEITTLVSDELHRRHDQWRRTIEAVKETLTGLEQHCKTADTHLADQLNQPTDAISALVEKLVAAATTESEARAMRVRAEVEIESARLQTLADRLQSELEAERTKLKAASDDLESERRTRAGAETALEESRSQLQTLQAELESGRAEVSRLSRQHESDAAEVTRLNQQRESDAAEVARLNQQMESDAAQVARLSQQIEAEKAAHAKILTAFQTVQRALSLAESSGPSQDPAPASPTPSARADRERSTPAEAAAQQVNRSLKLVRAASAPAGAEQEELIEYVKQLFDQIEAIYRSDLGSATDTSDVVDRLTANLRYAHDVFARRVSSADGGDLALFEQQLAILLDARSETSFGRHLAIAAFNYAPSETTPP